MSGLLEILLVAGVTWALLMHGASGRVWAMSIGAYLVLRSLYAGIGPWTAGAWILFVPLAAIMASSRLRRQWLSRPVLDLFRKVLPAMSDTEREALEAGNVWWDADLFSGKPDWGKLLAFRLSKLNAQEQAFMDGPVESLCQRLDDWQITEQQRDLPEDVWQFLKDNGFFGLIIPPEFGGKGFSARLHSDVVMKVASRSITAAVTVMVPNSLGPAKLLMHYGTPAQKQYYLPRLADGREIPCFALTGPEAGSDAGAMPDLGIVCRQDFQGQADVLGIRLNWDKRYITLGPVATVLGLAFKLRDPDHLLSEVEDRGITLALIPTDLPGIEIGNRHCPLNLPFQNGPNSGRNVFIPLDWIIGGAERIGQGWTMLMQCLADGRSISLPALSTGAGKLASRATGAYAAVRKQFKVPIGNFEGVSEALARIAANTYQMDAARELTVSALDQGESPSVISAIVKYHLTETMRKTINDAMDIQGGSGICLGPRNLLGRVYQALPISITVEGANILTRNMIIFGQGAIRCHPYVLREMHAAQNEDRTQGLIEFDRALFAHVRYAMRNASRSLFHGLTGAVFMDAPTQAPTARYFSQLELTSARFCLLADITMLTLGGKLKLRERISARLGDVLSALYLGSAVLKRFHASSCPEEDWPLLEYCMQENLYMAQEQLLAVMDNFPHPLLGVLLKRVLFPYGRRQRPPSDTLAGKAAQVIMRADDARERLTRGVYVPVAEDEALARLDKALETGTLAQPVLQLIRGAMRDGRLPRGDPEEAVNEALERGVIDAAQAEQVRVAMVARQRVIHVDDFPPELFTREHSAWADTETTPAQSTS